jgi:hypothetical protein
MHELDNVYVADGSVFVSSGGFNPTVTIMALALRMARHLTGAAPAAPAPAQAKAGPGRLAATGGSGAVAAAGATAAAAGLALRGADRRVQGSTKAHPSTGGSHGEGQPDP